MLIWGFVIGGAVWFVIETNLYLKRGRENGWSVVRRAGAISAFTATVTILALRWAEIPQEYLVPVQVFIVVFDAGVSLLMSYALYWAKRRLMQTIAEKPEGKQTL